MSEKNSLNNKDSTFPGLSQYSELTGHDEEILLEAFEVEAHYHKLLLSESELSKRKAVYREFYNKLLPIYDRTADHQITAGNPKLYFIEKFKEYLIGKSIIDFGCGEGDTLKAILEHLPHKGLCGIDTFIPKVLAQHKKISFVESDIIELTDLNRKYQVAISDNVVEHLVLIDAIKHLEAVYRSLEEDGMLILVMPNKLFGPCDITRIKDFSHSGRTQALGGHVNESTFTEMIGILTQIGFKEFRTVAPLPLVGNINISTRFITTIENSPLMLKLFRAIKIDGVCPVRFTITLLAKKG